MKKLILFLFIALNIFACKESENERKTRFFCSYMKEHFSNFEIEDGEYLFILPRGCEPCKNGCINMLYLMQEINGKEDLLNKNYVAMLISKESIERYSPKILTLHKNVLVDTTNMLDKMYFDIYGISVLKIKDKKIVGSKSMSIKDYEKDPKLFFKTRL